MHAITPVLTFTLRAKGPILARRFVAPDGSQATYESGAVGIARTAAADGEAVAVDALGVLEVEAGSEVAIKDQIGSDADGRAVPNAGFMLALSAATAAGQTILVGPLVCPPFAN